MSLFFDATWFDARLSERGLDRSALAAAAGLERAELHRIYANERAASPDELRAFAQVLSADLVEVSLRAGVSNLAAPAPESSVARIESIEARLDAIDTWLEEFEQSKKALKRAG